MNNISDIEDIENLIKEYAKSYYLGEPIATDEQFDALVNLLEAQDPSNPLLSTVGWGCHYGDKVLLDFPFAKSLPKIKKASDYSKTSALVTPKIDGMSIFIEYDENCNIKMVATREGVVITPKSLLIRNIPAKCLEKNTLIRGELYISMTTFAQHLADDFANPRNAVAGIVNRKSMDLLEHVRFLAHGDLRGSVEGIFYVPSVMVNELTDERLREIYDDHCEYSDLPIDGLVLDGTVAYKVATEEAVARVESLEWNLTDRKQMMPTVIFEDGIRLYGTKVKRATGIHAQWVVSNKVDSGALVKVTKANEIIPQITEVLVPVDGEVSVPSQCPSCAGALTWEGVSLMCANSLCSYRHSLTVFMKTHFQCDGVKNTKDIIDALDIQSFDDILKIRGTYKLADLTDQLADYPKIGFDKARKIAELLLYKHINASEFLKSLGLRGVGDTISKKAGKFLLTLEQSYPIQSLIVMIDAPSNVKSALLANSDLVLTVYNMFKPWIIDDSEPATLNTMKVVLTGKMSEERKVIELQLRRVGIESVGSVTKDVSYLVQADPSSISSKTKTATKLGIPIISEEEMRSMFL